MKNLKVLFAVVLVTCSIVACKEAAPADDKGTTVVKEEVKETPDTTQKVEAGKPDTGIVVKETAK